MRGVSRLLLLAAFVLLPALAHAQATLAGTVRDIVRRPCCPVSPSKPPVPR